METSLEELNYGNQDCNTNIEMQNLYHMQPPLIIEPNPSNLTDLKNNTIETIVYNNSQILVNNNNINTPNNVDINNTNTNNNQNIPSLNIIN
jgi:hypothetical protein